MVITPGPAGSPSRSPAWRPLHRSERAPSRPASRSRSWARAHVGLAMVDPRAATPLDCGLGLRSPPARRLDLVPLLRWPPRPEWDVLSLYQPALTAKGWPRSEVR